jgi:mono/diheme cytochrome c family protein
VTPAALQGEITELDAMVAYLQKLGRDLKASQKPFVAPATAEAAETKNPYAGNRGAEEEGEKIFQENCRSCHGEKGAGGFGPKLATTARKFGGSDAELFSSVAGGRPGGMPAFLPQLGKDRVWKRKADDAARAGVPYLHPAPRRSLRRDHRVLFRPKAA